MLRAFEAQHFTNTGTAPNWHIPCFIVGMHIHARALKYFDMIRRCGSIREAARHLHVASSAVNRQLLILEDEVGSPLFDRLSSGLILTPAGEAFARHVLNVLQDESRLLAELDMLRGIRRGSIHIVAVEGVNADLMPTLLSLMHQRYPGVRLDLSNYGSEKVAQAVLQGDADIGIGFSIGHKEGLRLCSVARFDVGVIMAPSHPLAHLTRVSIRQCVEHPLILPAPKLSIHALLQPHIANFKSTMQVVVESSSIELAKQLTERGLGLSFQSRLGLERELAEGRLRYIPLDTSSPLQCELGICVRSERTLSPAMDAFLKITDEVLHARLNE